MDDKGLRDVYERAIQLNRETFLADEFDLAYHALMLGLHCGQRLNEVELLAEVERLAQEQMEYIDEHHPDYVHSSQSAKQRGHYSIFFTAAKQARARILILEKHP